MGDLLHFPVHRTTAPAAAVASAPAFYFDVTDPLSYLIAERVERTLGDVQWVVVDGSALPGTRDADGGRSERRVRAEARAQALRLPLVWPERLPAWAPCALRATAFACELGAGAAFALAISRLVFCGGFDVDDPETLAEAAAAAAVPLGACLEAAGETWRDDELRETARALVGEGVTALPALQVGARWLQGEALLGAGSLVSAGRTVSHPLAPVG